MLRIDKPGTDNILAVEESVPDAVLAVDLILRALGNRIGEPLKRLPRRREPRDGVELKAGNSAPILSLRKLFVEKAERLLPQADTTETVRASNEIPTEPTTTAARRV